MVFWVLGIGFFVLVFWDCAQSPIPIPQSPIPNPQSPIKVILFSKIINYL